MDFYSNCHSRLKVQRINGKGVGLGNLRTDGHGWTMGYQCDMVILDGDDSPAPFCWCHQCHATRTKPPAPGKDVETSNSAWWVCSSWASCVRMILFRDVAQQCAAYRALCIPISQWLMCFNVLHYPISEIRGPNIRYDRIRRSQKTVEPRTLKGALQPKLPEIEALTAVEARGSVAVQPHNRWGSFEYTHPSGEVEPNLTGPYTLKTQLISKKTWQTHSKN